MTNISITDDMTKRTIDNLTRYVFIQLPFFKNVEEECDTECDKWIYNIKNMGTTQNVAFSDHRNIFAKLEKVGRLATLSTTDRDNYEAELKFKRDKSDFL